MALEWKLTFHSVSMLTSDGASLSNSLRPSCRRKYEFIMSKAPSSVWNINQSTLGCTIVPLSSRSHLWHSLVASRVMSTPLLFIPELSEPIMLDQTGNSKKCRGNERSLRQPIYYFTKCGTCIQDISQQEPCWPGSFTCIHQILPERSFDSATKVNAARKEAFRIIRREEINSYLALSQ